jgi:hypothetical protein
MQEKENLEKESIELEKKTIFKHCYYLPNEKKLVAELTGSQTEISQDKMRVIINCISKYKLESVHFQGKIVQEAWQLWMNNFDKMSSLRSVTLEKMFLAQKTVFANPITSNDSLSLVPGWITELKFLNCNISNDIFQLIRSTLPKEIRSLSFNGCIINKDISTYLSQQLTSYPSLQLLDLRDIKERPYQFPFYDYKALLALATQHTGLQSIELSTCGHEAKEIAIRLQKNQIEIMTAQYSTVLRLLYIAYKNPLHPLSKLPGELIEIILSDVANHCLSLLKESDRKKFVYDNFNHVLYPARLSEYKKTIIQCIESHIELKEADLSKPENKKVHKSKGFGLLSQVLKLSSISGHKDMIASASKDPIIRAARALLTAINNPSSEDCLKEHLEALSKEPLATFYNQCIELRILQGQAIFSEPSHGVYSP